MCIGENEENSPWDPYHVDKGFNLEESTVSVFITNGELDVQDQGNDTAEGLLKTVAYGATFGNRGLWGNHGEERLILLPPDVAGPVGAQGFTKSGSKEFLHMHANGSLGKMTQFVPLENEARVAAHWKWMKGLSERELLELNVPVLESAERFEILVVGSDRAKTLVMPSGPASITVPVDKYRP